MQLLLTQSEWEARQKKSTGEGSGGRRSQDGGGRGRGRGRGGGHGGRSSGQKEAGKESTGKCDKSHIKCFKCQKYGHYANQCPEKKKEEEAHHVEAVEMEPSVLLAETIELGPPEDTMPRTFHSEVYLEEKMVSPKLHFTRDEKPTSDVWYLDNSASSHMTGDRLKFRDIDQAISGKVKFGDGSSVEIMGKGTILFQGRTGD